MVETEEAWKTLDRVLEGCRELGITKSEREGSELLIGKTASYLSCRRARRKPVSVDGLLHLYLRLGEFISIFRRAVSAASTLVEGKVYDNALEHLAEMRQQIWWLIEVSVRKT